MPGREEWASVAPVRMRSCFPEAQVVSIQKNECKAPTVDGGSTGAGRRRAHPMTFRLVRLFVWSDVVRDGVPLTRKHATRYAPERDLCHE